MKDSLGEFAILDHNLIETSKLNEYICLENSVYEVIRVIDGIPLFLEDHLTRLYDSVKILGYNYNDSEIKIGSSINGLIASNSITNGNFKIIVSFKNTPPRFIAYIMQHSYPAIELYKTGISTSVLFAERKNPNAKNFQSVRELAQKTIKEREVYEVIFVSENGSVTEGSKSNLFFINGNKLITAPSDAVLKGITRKYVLKAAFNIKLEVEERNISLKELPNFEVAFISGTSPKVLPIKNIDQFSYNVSNSKLTLLMKEFDLIMKNYILEKKKISNI